MLKLTQHPISTSVVGSKTSLMIGEGWYRHVFVLGLTTIFAFI
jgi:hypothetical protein